MSINSINAFIQTHYIDSSRICEILLEEWVAEAPIGENRALAQEKIQYFLRNVYITELELNNLNLTSLPDIFNDLRFSRLKSLDLDRNRLTNLPESIGNLQALTYLYLQRNQLANLPESIGNLQALTYLDLQENQLANLPESIGNLQALTYLYLQKNQLTNLPESISNLRSLTRLLISSNVLVNLPDESIAHLQSLNRLTRLRITNDEPFDSLRLWGRLLIIHNRLADLPDGSTIRSLIISDQLADLPDESTIRSLIISDQLADRKKSIEESLNHLYAIIGKIPEHFTKLEETSELCSWLHRLSHTADYQLGGASQKAFAAKILDYLSQADKDEGFRTVFYQVIQDATTTCGDRVALSILHLSIAHQLAKIDLKDMKKLANFLIKGPWTIEMLQDIARNKIKLLAYDKAKYDEIEVYLGYPIKLKENLGIPIDVQDMLYFASSSLEDEDLQEAKDFVLSKQTNQEECFEFLAKHSKWVEALSANYPEEYQAILNKRTEAAMQEDPDYEGIAKEWKKDLVALTEKVLQN